MIAYQDLERIVNTGKKGDSFRSRRYEVLTPQRQLKSYLRPEARKDYMTLGIGQ